MIFVFGSNLAGRHGKGAALHARKHHGAIYWQGIGRQGDSYAIPTKDAQLRTLPLADIKIFVDGFIRYAIDEPSLQFQVTAIGTGLAGYRHEDIAPMFAKAPANCRLPDEWLAIMSDNQQQQKQQERPVSVWVGPLHQSDGAERLDRLGDTLAHPPNIQEEKADIMAWTPPKPAETYETLVKQFRALCALHASVEAQLRAIQRDQHREMQARAQLDGERAANQVLTDEVERLLAENDRLRNRMSAIQQ